jgi:hypothetical protein
VKIRWPTPEDVFLIMLVFLALGAIIWALDIPTTDPLTGAR